MGGREEKVAYYYNQMEHGLLEPDGVSDRVLDALAAIVDTTRDALRGAGERVAPPEAGEGAVFARKAYADADYGGEDLTGAPASAAERARDEAFERDEVDELFLGG